MSIRTAPLITPPVRSRVRLALKYETLGPPWAADPWVGSAGSRSERVTPRVENEIQLSGRAPLISG